MKEWLRKVTDNRLDHYKTSFTYLSLEGVVLSLQKFHSDSVLYKQEPTSKVYGIYRVKILRSARRAVLQPCLLQSRPNLASYWALKEAFFSDPSLFVPLLQEQEKLLIETLSLL